MLRFLKSCAIIATVALVTVNAEDPEVSFSGYLDADVVGDLKGSYYTNSELDLGMSIGFSEKLSANVYATVLSSNAESGTGSIPAGDGLPSDRWVNIAFDGFDISYATAFGTFSVGDLVYQYGSFNYYYYKRLSMITPETFTRGLRYSFGSDLITQEFTLGVSDVGGSSSYTDIVGTTGIKLSESSSLGLYYGLKNDDLVEFSKGSHFIAGTEYLGTFGEMLALKADVGYLGIAEGNSDIERANIVSILVEPTLTIGDFSAAFTGFVMIDSDSLINSANYLGLRDEMFFYLEPGYTFTDKIAAGLPLEYHAIDMDNEDDDEFWVVPTIYFTLHENVQWWVWGQMVTYLSEEDTDPDFFAGSEIIVNF